MTQVTKLLNILHIQPPAQKGGGWNGYIQ